MSHAISMRLSDELNKALMELARATERSKTYLISKAIESYLRDHADYQIALDRLHDTDDKIISSAELKKRLE